MTLYYLLSKTHENSQLRKPLDNSSWMRSQSMDLWSMDVWTYEVVLAVRWWRPDGGADSTGVGGLPFSIGSLTGKCGSSTSFFVTGGVVGPGAYKCSQLQKIVLVFLLHLLYSFLPLSIYYIYSRGINSIKWCLWLSTVNTEILLHLGVFKRIWKTINFSANFPLETLHNIL